MSEKKPEDPRKRNKQLRGSLEPIPGKCGARIKGTDPQKYCTRPPRSNGRCYHHGGSSLPPGPTHPTYKHGQHSALYPKGEIGDRIRQYVNDPDLLSASRCVALIQVRWLDLVKHLSSGESSRHWERLSKAAESFQSANKKIQEAIQEQQLEQSKPVEQQSLPKLNRIDERITASRKQASEALSTIMRLIAEGAPEQERWRELAALNRELAELQRLESSRIAEQQQMLSPEEAVTLMTATLAAIAKHVVEPKVRAAVAGELMRIWNKPERAVVGDQENVAGAVVATDAVSSAGPVIEGRVDGS